MPGFFDKKSIFNKKDKKDKEEIIALGQVSEIPYSDQNITISTQTVTDVLEKLRNTTDKYDAIDFIVDNTPDGKMALNTYLRLINQGVDVELIDANTGKPTKQYDAEWLEFCRTTLGGMSSNGLDGLLDQLYTSEILHGGMAVEVVVEKGAQGVESVVIIDPKTIKDWKYLPNEHRYAAYQQSSTGAKRDLFEGNFFWIPHQPKPGKPVGTLQFEPAIDVTIQLYQTLKDISVWLYRQGIAKYDVSINLEKLLADAPPEVLADRTKRKKLLEDTFNRVKSSMGNVARDSNFIHYDSINITTVGGGQGGTGLDIRAAIEVFDPLIVNAYQLTPVLMGRLNSGSYSLGTAEYKIAKDTMEVFRRSAKRMVENIINLWARVMGFNIYAKVTHHPIEWQVEKEKYEAQLLKLEKARRAEEYRYVDHNLAGMLALGDEASPQTENPDLYEYIKKDFSSSGEPTGTQADDKTKKSINSEDDEGEEPVEN